MITNLTTMDVLESCPKHNMVAYLEKTEGNAECPAKSKIINNVRYITATVSCARPGLSLKHNKKMIFFLMNVMGIDSSTKSAIFDAIPQLIRVQKAPLGTNSPINNATHSSGGTWEVGKSAKAEPSVHKDPLFDELADDNIGLYGD
ncbi:hypothetical protein Tco_0916810 [Tanacetum coccineum]